MITPINPVTWVRDILWPSINFKIPYPTASFANQVIIITGSNTGLGLEAARHIVRLGAAKVILAVRDTRKGEDAAASIISTTGVTKNVIEVWDLDLASYDSIHSFAERAKSLERLDAVLQNAGLATGVFRQTTEGEELTVATNTIGPILLGLLLLPKLRGSARETGSRCRLSFTGSDAYLFSSFKESRTDGLLLDVLRDERLSNMPDRYSVSKLLLLYATRELAARSPVSNKSNVVITTLTPGLCWSGLFREMPWFLMPIYWALMILIARPTEVGSRLLVDAVRPDLELETHGAFLLNAKPMINLYASVESDNAQMLAKNFNHELFRKLEEISPGATSGLSD